jgi:hypothetical protein
MQNSLVEKILPLRGDYPFHSDIIEPKVDRLLIYSGEGLTKRTQKKLDL